MIADATTVDVDAGYFTYEGVVLKWHYAVGLLYDMYVLAVRDHHSMRNQGETGGDGNDGSGGGGTVPFRLTVHFSSSSSSDTNTNTNAGAAATAATMIDPSPIAMHDAFFNSVKEADFLRSGTADPIRKLPMSDSKALWTSTQENDLVTFARIHQNLLPEAGRLRNIPLRVFMPTMEGDDEAGAKAKAQMKVLQAHVPPMVATAGGGGGAGAASARVPMGGSQPQTLGTALNMLLPGLFPSRRTPILARPLLHGAPLPMGANLEELVRWGCYADGWVGVVVAVNG